MEPALALALVAALLAAGATAVALDLRGRTTRLTEEVRSQGQDLATTRATLAETKVALAETQAALAETKVALAETEAALAELKAATEIVPAPPPLPKARSGGLDDLRQQLRAAHSAEAEDSEE
jgi:septal ring factor EnvC (AmiA/AmiB activator)